MSRSTLASSCWGPALPLHLFGKLAMASVHLSALKWGHQSERWLDKNDFELGTYLDNLLSKIFHHQSSGEVKAETFHSNPKISLSFLSPSGFRRKKQEHRCRSFQVTHSVWLGEQGRDEDAAHRLLIRSPSDRLPDSVQLAGSRNQVRLVNKRFLMVAQHLTIYDFKFDLSISSFHPLISRPHC